MSDPDEALTGRESSAASAAASPALIEAIAEAIVGVGAAYGVVRRPARPEAWYPEARAAYAAVVEHLGLVEERGSDEVPGRSRYRRLVSRWVEVDHG